MKTKLSHPGTIYFTIGFLFFLLLCYLHIGGCGVKASGGTTHRVEGEAVVRVEFDFSICNSLPEEARQECILTLLEILKNREDAA